MFGFRPDGRRLKDVDPLVQITPYLMPMRCDAQVFLQHRMDYEKVARYIAEKNRQGEKITFMQVIAAAYVRSVSQLPELNRFIYNKQYYARNNCSVSYVVLKDPQNNESNEVTARIEFDLTDTIFDVRDRMVAAQEKIRDAVFYRYPDRDVLVLFYGCRVASGEPRPLDCNAVAWALPDELPGFDFAGADLEFVRRHRPDAAIGR